MYAEDDKNITTTQNEQQRNNIDNVKKDLVQILKTLKKFYEYSIKYNIYDVGTDKSKLTIKHLIEQELITLKENAASLQELIEFIKTQINYTKQLMQISRQQNDQKQYSFYSKQLSYYIENLERVFNAYLKLNELIQKYYNTISDYENKLLDNINKTYRSLLYKEDKKSDEMLITEIYQRIEDIVKNINTTTSTNNDEVIDEELDILNEKLFNEDDKYKL